jgi:hypothetical protein
MQENHTEIDRVPDSMAEDSEMLQANLRAEFMSPSTLSRRTVRKSCIFFISNYESLDTG